MVARQEEGTCIVPISSEASSSVRTDKIVTEGGEDELQGVVADAKLQLLRGWDGAGRELLQGAQRNLQDLEEARVTKGGRDLALLRQAPGVGRHVHLADQLLEELQPENQVAGRRVQELAHLGDDLLVLLRRGPAELGHGGDELHQVRAHVLLAVGAVVGEVREYVVAKVDLLLGREVVPGLHQQLLESVRRNQLGIGQLRVVEHELALRDVLGRRRQLDERLLSHPPGVRIR